MTENTAIEKLGEPLLKAVSESWKGAWDDLRGQYNNPDHDNRCRSVLLQMQAVIRMRRISGSLGVRYLCDQTQHLFILPDTCCIVFKKLDEDNRPSVNQTERAKALLQSTLFPDLPTLIVGMAPTESWLSYTGVFLCCPNKFGTGNSWVLNITDGVKPIDSAQTVILPVISETDSLSTPGRSTRWKLKSNNNKKNSNDADLAGEN